MLQDERHVYFIPDWRLWHIWIDRGWFQYRWFWLMFDTPYDKLLILLQVRVFVSTRLLYVFCVRLEVSLKRFFFANFFCFEKPLCGVYLTFSSVCWRRETLLRLCCMFNRISYSSVIYKERFRGYPFVLPPSPHASLLSFTHFYLSSETFIKIRKVKCPAILIFFLNSHLISFVVVTQL